MAKFYQITNKHCVTKDFPSLRVWIRDGQPTFLGRTLLKLKAQEADTKQAFCLHVHIDEKNGKRPEELTFSPDSFLDMSRIGFLVGIRAAEWNGKDIPSRFLVEFVSLVKNSTLSICK